MKRLESLLLLLGTIITAYLLDLARSMVDMMSYRLSSAETLWLSLLLNLVFAGLMLGRPGTR